MARHLKEEGLRAIEEVLRQQPDGRTASQIADALISAPPLRTLQYRLKSLSGRSAARYAAVRQSLGERDPFRLQYRSELREVVGAVIRERMNTKRATAWIAAWAQEYIDQQHRERLREVAERELLNLHEGNFARFRVRPSEFEAWQEVWSRERAQPPAAEKGQT